MDLVSLDLNLTKADLKNIDRVIRQMEKERETYNAEKHLETTSARANEELN